MGLRVSLSKIYDRYRLHLFVVENRLGVCDKVKVNGVIKNEYQISYLKKYIEAMKDAIKLDGVQLMGFTPWGVVSTGAGEMNKRYGFVYVNR